MYMKIESIKKYIITNIGTVNKKFNLQDSLKYFSIAVMSFLAYNFEIIGFKTEFIDVNMIEIKNASEDNSEKIPNSS